MRCGTIRYRREFGDPGLEAGKLPRILIVAEEQAILDACTRLRGRFLTPQPR